MKGDKECSRCHAIIEKSYIMAFGKYRNRDLCEPCYLHQCFNRFHKIRCKIDSIFNQILFILTGRILS